MFLFSAGLRSEEEDEEDEELRSDEGDPDSQVRV